MSFYFGNIDNGYSTPKSHSHNHRDSTISGEKYSSRHSRNSDDSRESERKPYHHLTIDDKEKLRDSYRDRADSHRSENKFSHGGMAGANLMKIDWTQFQIAPFSKDFYTEHEDVKNRSQQDIDAFRQQHQIEIRGKISPRPIFCFEEAQFPNYISSQLTNKYKTPTPIQCQGWPAALSGHDVIGIAQTGSGKTLTFLLPGFVHINSQSPLRPGDGPIGLILAPTRELAMQIHEECLKFGRDAKISSVCVFGGADRYSQQRELQRGNHIVVATPGRLLDFLEAGVINLRRVTYLVFDEADRMLDMGFEPQIRRIMSQVRSDRQTLMWSATWPREVQRLALEFCRENPVHIVIGNHDLSVNIKIEQNIEVIDGSKKRYRILSLLENIMDGSKMLIFCQTKRGADSLTNMLGNYGLSAISIHGDKTQSQRDYIMRQYKSGKCNILVATDLAARGLDVADIKYVINYDFPTHIEDYIHRVGRTGRAGRSGVSYTFFTRDDYKHSSSLIDILEESDQRVPDELYRMARRPIPMSNSRPYSRPSQKSTVSSNSDNQQQSMMQNFPTFTITLPKITLEQLQNPLADFGFYYNNDNNANNNDNTKAETADNPPVSDFTANVHETNETQAVDNAGLGNVNAMELYNQVQACFNLGSILSKMQGQPIDPTQQLLQNLSSFLQMNPQFLQQKP